MKSWMPKKSPWISRNFSSFQSLLSRMARAASGPVAPVAACQRQSAVAIAAVALLWSYNDTSGFVPNAVADGMAWVKVSHAVSKWSSQSAQLLRWEGAIDSSADWNTSHKAAYSARAGASSEGS
jgi:hypothetical protein